MIYAFTGKTGSGKTFLMVKTARKYWLNGTDIYSNTVLNFDTNKCDGYTIIEHPEKFTKLERLGWYLYAKIVLRALKRKIEPGIIPRRGKIVYFVDIQEIIQVRDGLILFDEAQVLFNARNWESLPYVFQYKLQQHRKHNLILFCTAQNLGTIDITYRRLIHKWLHCERVWTLGANPVFWGIFKYLEKDIDFLFNNVDDLKVPTIREKTFLIHRWKPKFYDTLYDIGFHPLKTICLTNYDEVSKKLRLKLMMLPKQMSLSEGLRLRQLLNSQLSPSKYKSYRSP